MTREISVALHLNDTWIDVSEDVREDDGIDIALGRSNESGSPDPSHAELTLLNNSGDYSPRNPLGSYYPQLGRNTPIRVGIVTARDAFSRTVFSSWGSADVGGVYTTGGAGGTVQNSDHNVASGVGTQSVPVVSGYRYGRLIGVSYRNVDVAVTFTLPFTDVLGGDVEPANIMLRGQTASHYYLVRVVVTSAEAVTVALMHRSEAGVTTTLASAVTVAGLTHTSAQAVRVRAQVEGQTLRAKVWPSAGDEPLGWQATAHSSLIDSPGFVGIRSGVSAANSNTLPIVYSYDNLVVTVPRFSGEVASWPQKWGLTGKDVYAPIEAAGITRRLGQGAAPVQSTFYRGITSLDTPAVAYWSGEDGVEATSLGSAVPGASPMYVGGSDTKYAEYAGFAASAPLSIPNGSYWVGVVPNYTITGQTQFRFLLHVPDSGIVDSAVITQLVCSGTAHHWEVKATAAGDLKLQCWSSADDLLLDSGYFAFAINGDNIMMSIELTQVGANIDWRLATLEPGQIGQVISGTLNSRTVGRATQVVMSLFGQLTDTAVGHINVRKEVTNLFDLAEELQAFAGETALTRIQRLCSQNNIPISYIGVDGLDSAAMGPQRVNTLLALLDECAEADQGTLYESLGELGLTYRERGSLYNQPAVLTLDYEGEQLSLPFDPVDDDQLTRNDVTANRTNGGSAREEITEGRLSVLPPPEGVGRYDTGVTVNVYSDEQLLDIAGWLAHVGTTDETRYPTVGIDHAAIAGDPDLAAAVLQFGLDDRFEIINPKVGQVPDTISQLARGYAEHISYLRHSIAINAAPASPYQVLALGGAGSRLDSDGSALASGVTNSATSFSVATATGPLWTTDAADLPIEFTLGGEVVSVGAISGASSPQTFSSITRSVNGVVKAHSSGAALRLTYRATLAL